MADVIDDDTCAAVLAAWQADATLPGLFARPPGRERLKAGQQGSLPPGSPALYARLECRHLRSASAGTAGAWHDHRKVTLTAYGVESAVNAAVQAMLNAFNSRTVLVYPSGARFIRWWPTTGGELKIDEKARQGQDVWQGVVEADVWSVRIK